LESFLENSDAHARTSTDWTMDKDSYR
jgi:hypothetical protein